LLDQRWKVVLATGGAALGVGLLLACAIWLGLDGGRGAVAAIDREEARMGALPALRRSAEVLSGRTTALLASPSLFSQPPPPRVRLDGLARTPGRVAALMAIGDLPAQWVVIGSTVNGVTLLRIGGNRATIDAGDGPQEISLGETVGSGASPTTTPTQASYPDQAPLGRGLEPASAPGM
jgi:hypothetical protein